MMMCHNRLVFIAENNIKKQLNGPCGQNGFKCTKHQLYGAVFEITKGCREDQFV